ncbi:6-bladed beta-propeller protein [Algoriphagus winogradskyi]|uniref:6-bladed beta-propeller protein n=3 Tax=Algoriphagus winogradskyi TaxID=237017 RepID=A0ABY1PCP7_9BACT|nr:6-bladed beta-propeller protein [Algoriphagus winogradskyi]
MRFLMIFGLVIILISCQNRQKTLGEIEVPLEHEKILTSTIFEKPSILRLKFNDRIYPSKIDQINFLDNHIYVLDKNFGIIFKFSKEGDLLTTLEKRGEGPEEYQYLHRFRVDTENKTIEVYDKVGQKIIIYDSNFKFKESIKIGLFFENFEKISDKKYLIYLAQENIFNGKNVSNNLIIWDNGEITFSDILQRPTDIKFQDNSIYFNRMSKSIYFTQAFNDTIYKFDVNVNRIVEKSIVNFPNKLFGSFSSIDEIDRVFNDKTYSTNIDYLVLNDKVISFNYIKSDNGALSFMRYFYFPHSNFVFQGTSLYNDFDGIFLFRHIYFRDNIFTYVVSPESLSNLDLEKVSEDLRGSIDESISFEDQFLLLSFKIKDNL